METRTMTGLGEEILLVIPIHTKLMNMIIEILDYICVKPNYFLYLIMTNPYSFKFSVH